MILFTQLSMTSESGLETTVDAHGTDAHRAQSIGIRHSLKENNISINPARR
ncbi:hypothetical protein Lepto7375DRAFT_0331 [Leptolyngbya sp. PCC 7375]|nr:hypothetical protein Lepto7375DRAFT_0331 [Leptolyngbya sp. PCC 7375]